MGEESAFRNRTAILANLTNLLCDIVCIIIKVARAHHFGGFRSQSTPGPQPLQMLKERACGHFGYTCSRRSKRAKPSRGGAVIAMRPSVEQFRFSSRQFTQTPSGSSAKDLPQPHAVPFWMDVPTVHLHSNGDFAPTPSV